LLQSTTIAPIPKVFQWKCKMFTIKKTLLSFFLQYVSISRLSKFRQPTSSLCRLPGIVSSSPGLNIARLNQIFCTAFCVQLHRKFNALPVAFEYISYFLKVQHSTIRRNSKLYTCLNKLYILH